MTCVPFLPTNERKRYFPVPKRTTTTTTTAVLSWHVTAVDHVAGNTQQHQHQHQRQCQRRQGWWRYSILGGFANTSSTTTTIQKLVFTFTTTSTTTSKVFEIYRCGFGTNPLFSHTHIRRVGQSSHKTISLELPNLLDSVGDRLREKRDIASSLYVLDTQH